MARAASALLLCVALATPAMAQGDRQPNREGALDRYDSAAANWDRPLESVGREAFGRGYRDGREAERRALPSRGASDGSLGPVWNDAVQSEAYERLERAAYELRRALVLMRREPSLPRLQGALVQTREALSRTQNAMTWLPEGVGRGDPYRYERRSGRAIGAEKASGGWES